MSECTNENGGTRVTLAFATGALVGAGVAILFAPQSGKETRDMVASKANDLKDVAGDVIERGKHMVSDVKHKANDAFDKGKQVAHEALQG